MANPIFPLDEYIPDGEPHVFGERVYLYGSHDAEGGDRFCMKDYTVYSASVNDLEHWTCHGVIYKKSQDPRSHGDKLVDYYAPDCVRGNDGRYYLYYCAMGPNVKNFGTMSVAVSDFPEGPFEYVGDIRYPDGRPMTMFLTNDPAVINDKGRIWMYYGWGLGRDFRSKLLSPIYNVVQSKIFSRPISEIKTTKPSILSCAVVEMEEDMITVKSNPKSVLDSKTTADKKSELYHHPFYEAASIRKFGDLYYLVYSSGANTELAYATSKYPDHDFQYRGVIISNSDLGYKGNKKAKAAGGTIHGGIECINGKYYVFYHRCTHNTDFSRQACAEPIVLHEDGTIEMVEITTQGLHNGPLSAKGKWEAIRCCNLFNDKTNLVQGNNHRHDRPTIVCENGEHFITAIDDNTTIGYKYLDFCDVSKLEVTVRGGKGILLVITQLPNSGNDEQGLAEATAVTKRNNIIGSVQIDGSSHWQTLWTDINVSDGTHALYFIYKGSEKLDFLTFTIK